MRYFLTLLLLVSVCALRSTAQINYAEYYISQDPALGRATPVSVASGDDVAISFDVPLASSSPGVYVLGVRTRDTEGRWSHTTMHTFVVTDPLYEITLLAGAEYFINTDPGFGKGIPVLVPGPRLDANMVFDVDLSGLQQGFHRLYVRAQDTKGRWSQSTAHIFYLKPDGETVDIEAFHYYFTRPDFESDEYVHQLVVPATDVDEEFTADLSGLPGEGDYLMHIYAVSASGLESLVKTVEFTVENEAPAEQAITFPALPDKVYGDADFTLGATASSGLPVTYTSSDNTVATIDNNGRARILKAGAATITAHQQGNDEYLPAADVSRTLTVAPATRTLTFAPLSNATFGDNPITPNATVNTSETISFTSSNTAVATVAANNTLVIHGAGTTTITASVPENPNYTGQRTMTRELRVGQAAQQITFASISAKRYGDANFSLNATASSGLAVTYISSDEDIARITANGQVQLLRPGTVTITARQAGNANYLAANAVSRAFSVSKATLTITAPSHTRQYGESNPSLVPKLTGFVHNDGPSVLQAPPVAATTATLQSVVGTYPISVSGAVSDHYQFVYVAGTLTVNPAVRELVFGELSPTVYGGLTIALQAVVNTAEAISYTSSNPAVARIAEGNTVVIEGTGTAMITASVPENSNYTGARSVSRELRVDKASQVISYEPIPTLWRGGATHGIQVSSDSGLPVSLSLSDGYMASLDGHVLTPLRIGHSTVIASQAGNENYLPAVPVEIAYEIVGDESALVRVHPAVSPDGDGVNDFLLIEGISSYPNNRISIFTPNGHLVFEARNYDNGQQVFDGTSNRGMRAKLPQGTYFYVLELDVYDRQVRQTGYFVLRY